METVVAQLLERARHCVNTHIENNNNAIHPEDFKCLSCGLPGRVQETLAFENVFCKSRECHVIHRALDQFFGLGMPKRLLDIPNVALDSVTPFPDDILCYLILLAFGSRLQSLEEYDYLFSLRKTSVQFRRVIDHCVVENIRDIDDKLVAEIMEKSGTQALLQFSGLQRLKVSEGDFSRDQAAELLSNLPALNELYIDGDVVTTKMLAEVTQLSRLTINSSEVEDASFDNMKRLTSLSIRYTEGLTKDALAKLTQLDTLLLHEGTATMELASIVNLSTLVLFRNSHSNVEGMNAHGNMVRLWIASPIVNYDDQWLLAQTKLNHLVIYNVNSINDAIVSRLTALKSLILDTASSDVISSASISLLTNLKALAIDTGTNNDGYSVETFAPLSNTLSWLSLKDSANGFGSGIVVTLKNLTYLDISNLPGAPDFRLTDDELGQLIYLETLVLDSNNVITGKSFGKLINLRALSLRFNRFVKKVNLLLLADRLEILEISRTSNIGAMAVSKMTRLRMFITDEMGYSFGYEAVESLPDLEILIEGSSLPRWDKKLIDRESAGLLNFYYYYASDRPQFPKGARSLPQWQFLNFHHK